MKPLALSAARVDVRATVERRGPAAVADDVVDLPRGVAELGERRRHRLVDDLEVPAAGELLELHEREVGLDAGRVAVHDEADGARRRDDRDLGVAVAVLLAEFEHPVALAARRGEQVRPGSSGRRCRPG